MKVVCKWILVVSIILLLLVQWDIITLHENLLPQGHILILIGLLYAGLDKNY